jgi:hypothetical protein
MPDHLPGVYAPGYPIAPLCGLGLLERVYKLPGVFTQAVEFGSQKNIADDVSDFVVGRSPNL